MAAPLVLKSLHLFHFTQACILHRKSIISWNNNAQKFYSEKKLINKFRWYVSVSTVIINILLGIVFLAFMLSWQLDISKQVRLNANEFFITFYAQLICIVVFAFDCAIYKYRQVLVIYINCFFFIFLPTPDKLSKKRETPWHTEKVGCLGITMMLPLYSGGILFVLICGLEIVNCTMLPVAIDFIFAPEKSRSYLFFLLKLISSVLFHWELVLEMTTCLIMVLVNKIYIVAIHFSYLRAISRLPTKYCHLGSLEHLMRTYQQLIVLHSLILDPSSKIVAIIMGFGFYLRIFSVSLLVYGWMDCIKILVVALPLAPLALECSENLLYRWSNMPEKFRGGRGYLKRLFKSLRPTEFICGEVGVLDWNRSTMYVASIIESSMTFLLLFGTVTKVYL